MSDLKRSDVSPAFSRSSSAQPARAMVSSNRRHLRGLVGPATGARRRRRGHEPLHDGVVLLRRGDMGPGLQQRQRTAPDEINLESEETVLRAGRLPKRIEIWLDLEQPRDEPADMRRHTDKQVRNGKRGPRRVRLAAIRVPFGPERGIGRLHVFAESFVQRRETLWIVEIGKGVAGNAEYLSSVGIRDG